MKLYWFWAWIRLITVVKGAADKTKGITWDNLIIINAANPDEAFKKAEMIGKSQAGDDNESLILDGKKAISKYLGILDMGLIHDEIEDGSEILFRESRQILKKAVSKTRRKSILLAKIQKEFAPRLKADGSV